METEEQQLDEEEEDKDNVILFPVSTKTDLHRSDPIGLGPCLTSGPKKWSPRSLQDSNRKSAFQPYKQQRVSGSVTAAENVTATVLTNLQRGNVQAETVLPEPSLTFHVKAGRGELTEQDVQREPSVDVKDAQGLTALHWASWYGQYNTVELLLDNGANVHAIGPEEETPLILAASEGHHEVVRLLVEKNADVNHIDHLCNSALMYAAKGNHPHTCQELLQNGADITITNFNDDTAHIIAVENNSVAAQTVIENFVVALLE